MFKFIQLLNAGVGVQAQVFCLQSPCPCPYLFLGVLFSKLGPWCVCVFLSPLTLPRLFSRKRTLPVGHEGSASHWLWFSFPKPLLNRFFYLSRYFRIPSIFPPTPQWTWLCQPYENSTQTLPDQWIRESAFYYNRRHLIWTASQVSIQHNKLWDLELVFPSLCPQNIALRNV